MKRVSGLIFIFFFIFLARAEIKYGVEFSGGYGFVKPGDLNLAPEMGRLLFYDYEGFINAGQSSHTIEDVVKEEGEDFTTVKGGLSIDGRIKVLFSPNFGLSVGLNYLRLSTSAKPTKSYTYVFVPGGEKGKASFFGSEDIFVEALTPVVALHLILPRSSAKLSGEVWAGAGYTIVDFECNLASQVTFEKDTGSWSEYITSLQQTGSSKNLSFVFGGRVNVKLGKGFAAFAGADYLMAEFKKVKGDGFLRMRIRDSSGAQVSGSDNWTNASWYIAELKSWDRTFRVALNSPRSLDDKKADFVLDLSGARVFIGLSMGF